MAATFVNGVAITDTVGVGSIAATAQSHTSGNSIIVAVGNYTSGGVAVAGIADTAGNTYTKKGSTYNADANSSYEIWSADNITGNASNVVTATFAATASFRTIQVCQYSGLLAAGSYDASSAGSLPASSTTQTTATVTTTEADDLLLGFFSAWGASRTVSGSGGSTIRVIDADPSQVVIAEKIATAAGGYTVAIGLSSAEQFQCIAVAFKIEGGAASVVPVLIQQMSDAGQLSMKDTALAATLLATSKIKTRREAIAALAAYGLLIGPLR